MKRFNLLAAINILKLAEQQVVKEHVDVFALGLLRQARLHLLYQLKAIEGE